MTCSPKMAPVAYEPDAHDPAWAVFLETTTGGDAELDAAPSRRLHAHGRDREEARLFFALGREATGKSTFLGALKATLGDYAKTADFETFVAHRGESGPRADVARLMGARMVASLEVDEESAWPRVLSSSSRAAIPSRRGSPLPRELRVPAGVSALAGRQRSPASQRRRRDLAADHPGAFVEQVPEHERDPELKRHLTTDPQARSAILTWAISRLSWWQRDGLGVPQRVRDYTAEYRAENDPRRGMARSVLSGWSLKTVADLRSSL